MKIALSVPGTNLGAKPARFGAAAGQGNDSYSTYTIGEVNDHIRAGNYARAEEFFRQSPRPVSPDAVDTSNISPLQAAIGTGKPEAVQFVLEKLKPNASNVLNEASGLGKQIAQLARLRALLLEYGQEA